MSHETSKKDDPVIESGFPAEGVARETKNDDDSVTESGFQTTPAEGIGIETKNNDDPVTESGFQTTPAEGIARETKNDDPVENGFQTTLADGVARETQKEDSDGMKGIQTSPAEGEGRLVPFVRPTRPQPISVGSSHDDIMEHTSVVTTAATAQTPTIITAIPTSSTANNSPLDLSSPAERKDSTRQRASNLELLVKLKKSAMAREVLRCHIPLSPSALRSHISSTSPRASPFRPSTSTTLRSSSPKKTVRKRAKLDGDDNGDPGVDDDEDYGAKTLAAERLADAAERAAAAVEKLVELEERKAAAATKVADEEERRAKAAQLTAKAEEKKADAMDRSVKAQVFRADAAARAHEAIQRVVEAQRKTSDEEVRWAIAAERSAAAEERKATATEWAAVQEERRAAAARQAADEMEIREIAANGAAQAAQFAAEQEHRRAQAMMHAAHSAMNITRAERMRNAIFEDRVWTLELKLSMEDKILNLCRRVQRVEEEVVETKQSLVRSSSDESCRTSSPLIPSSSSSSTENGPQEGLEQASSRSPSPPIEDGVGVPPGHVSPAESDVLEERAHQDDSPSFDLLEDILSDDNDAANLATNDLSVEILNPPIPAQNEEAEPAQPPPLQVVKDSLELPEV